MPHKKRSYSGTDSLTLKIVFLLIAVYVAVMLISGYAALSVVAVALSAAAALGVLIVYLASGKLSSELWTGYLLLVGGVLIYYLIWGAEPFLKRTGYNLALSAIPILSAFGLFVIRKKYRGRFLKTFVSLTAVLMIFSSSFYLLAMSIRAKPKVVSLRKGHDDYLDAVGSASADSPNILFILMDDMAYSDISCYSYRGRAEATIQTPNLDALADEGARFENFYSCSPVCSPSRFGILTGRYSARGYMDQVVFPSVVSFDPFGATRFYNPFIFKNNVEGILGDEITFPEALQSAGYSTALFGKWNLGDYGEYLPTKQGFDTFYGSYYVNDMTPYNWVIEEGGKATVVKTHDQIKDQSETTKLLTAEVNNYIKTSVAANKKFLAYYASPWPHYPIYSGENGNPADDNYIDCIEEFDYYLGTIIDTLKTSGVYDDTLIVFTSDNGPGREGVAGALRGRKGTTFDGGQKVPLIVTYKNGGITPGSIVKTNAMNIDFFPTFLDYAGINNLPGDRVIDGASLYDILENGADAPHHEAMYHLRTGKVQAVQMPVEVDGEIKVFKYYKSVASENTAFFDQVYKNYLFNLTDDPAEGYNVAMVYPEVAKKLALQLETFKRELKTDRRGIVEAYYE